MKIPEISICHQKPMILIVDDDLINQETLIAFLEQDYQIKLANNGIKAIEIAEHFPYPDLILLDINMPDMDGYEVCQNLQKNPHTSAIPVIFVTSSTDHQSEVRGLELGAVDYITKPINPTIVLLRVRNQLLIKQSKNKQRLAAIVFEHTQECIVITDALNNIVDINPAFTRLTGYSREDVLGKNPKILSSGHQDKTFYAALWQSIKTTGFWSGELCNRTKSGEFYPQLLSISAVTDNHGEICYYVGISSDISLLKQHQKQLEYMAYYDALTGIPNRLLLADRMKLAIAHAKREIKMLAVCYLDLDGFKAVNDSLGHQAGDTVLVEIARRLTHILREEDTVARLGGDEFVVLLPDLTHEQACQLTLKRILEIISQPIIIHEQCFLLTASMGVSLFPKDNNDSDMLLRHADQAMYRAKQMGKNNYCFFEIT